MHQLHPIQQTHQTLHLPGIGDLQLEVVDRLVKEKML